jgi:hypothetical protein
MPKFNRRLQLNQRISACARTIDRSRIEVYQSLPIAIAFRVDRFGRRKTMRKGSILVSLLSLIFGVTLLRGQEKPGSIVVKLDPALDRIVAPDVAVETLLSKEGTFEGPTWVRDGKSGYLIFSDIPGGVINKLGPDDKVSVFRDVIGAPPVKTVQTSAELQHVNA